ncbi:MAG: hypothetical protein SVY41_01005 [Candidatus Nanohaloarchaea archaeon]|nr:hypothetical protein [Candidatus Nanohaloarchaea archaeon]
MAVTLDRKTSDLFLQRDIHAVLLVAMLDIVTTVYSMNMLPGVRANMFFQPLTDTAWTIFVAAAFYALVILAAGLILEGTVRKGLASIVFGMHTTAILFSGVRFADIAISGWWYTLVLAAVTALFYGWEENGCPLPPLLDQGYDWIEERL